MKTNKYTLNDSDIEAIVFSLSILPSLGLEDNELQAVTNYQLCTSAVTKLLNHNFNISNNETRIISCALQAVQVINSGGLSFVDSDVRKQCSNYLFTVNKLASVFDL